MNELLAVSYHGGKKEIAFFRRTSPTNIEYVIYDCPYDLWTEIEQNLVADKNFERYPYGNIMRSNLISQNATSNLLDFLTWSN